MITRSSLRKVSKSPPRASSIAVEENKSASVCVKAPSKRKKNAPSRAKRARHDHDTSKKNKVNKNKAASKKIEQVSIDFKFGKEDPIVKHLREFCKTKTPEQQTSIETEILDQICLEGLSGITLTRLFLILEAAVPNFKCTTDQSCQLYVWSMIVNKYLRYPSGANVQAFYLDPKTIKASQGANEGNETKPASRIILDKPLKLPLSTMERTARLESSLYPVQDGQIMGSCANYCDRLDITQYITDIAQEQDSMYIIEKQYGFENIYFVGSQILRKRAILPKWADPNVDIKLREYCTLELIGMSRTLGSVFPNDKSLGRYRIMLLAKGFITQVQDVANSPIEHHLIRFQQNRPSFTALLASKQSKVIDSSDEDDDNGEQPLSNSVCQPSQLKVNRGTLITVYDAIAESDGLTQIELRKTLRIPRFHLRNHLKNLLSIKMICTRSKKNTDNPFRYYKTVHKIEKKKKRHEEFEHATGIMAKWDAADLRAKKIIGHKRSNFNQAEDSLLILCRITSILIEPGLRLSWCVHKRVVRDLLHKELIESHDKTSDACLRRIKYLKRLPNNIMSINELTAELQDDTDISRLIERYKPYKTEDKLNKLFVKVLKTVRAKIPSLLGMTGPIEMGGLHSFGLGGSKLSIESVKLESAKENAQTIEISNHQEMKEKFELVDCQSVASIKRPPTFEKPKNVVDIKFNTASLVTMAFTLSNSLHQDTQTKRTFQWLLEKFYSSQHDKLISSVLSRLTKRSLLTRKCPSDQSAAVYKPRTKTSLKLNQSVHFLLNRHHSTSLMQLARPIHELDAIELSESNEMAPFALLTSLCSSVAFNLVLNLTIPTNFVGTDQDCVIGEPCKIKFRWPDFIFSEKQQQQRDNNKFDWAPFDMFLELDEKGPQEQDKQQQQTNWLVKSFCLPKDKSKDLIGERDFEAAKVPIEYQARLWKCIDGSCHMPTLLKLIEALLSWIIVMPGVEQRQLQREFGHLMPEEHLFELLNLMENLKFIKSEELKLPNIRPLLFGYTKILATDDESVTITYEPISGAFARYSQMLYHTQVTLSI